MTIAKLQLKQEIDRLDEQYLELIYNILRQFPHQPNTPNSVNKPTLLKVLATLEDIEDKFPGVGCISGSVMHQTRQTPTMLHEYEWVRCMTLRLYTQRIKRKNKNN